MKKIVFIFLVAAAVSCKKELTGNDAFSKVSVSSESADNARVTLLNRATKFGCMIGGSFTTDKRISVAHSLNVDYVRSGITMSQWDGFSGIYESYVNDGINVVLNVNYESQTLQSAPFPKNLTSYRKTFTEIVNKYQPEVIVVENEEINERYHSGPMADYIEMLKVALDVCHAKGIKVTNGGIYGSQLEILTYRYLQTKGQKRADSFANNCMSEFQVKAAKTPNSNPTLEKTVRQLDTLLKFYPNIDYINIHMYEPFDPDVTNTARVTTTTPVVIADIQEYIKVKTGKEAITNETGQRDNTDPNLVTAMLTEYDRLRFPYVIWYSGDGSATGGGSMPLYNLSTGKLGSNGQAFANFMANY